jgi:hypothetical protein
MFHASVTWCRCRNPTQPKGFDSEVISFSGDCGMVSLPGMSRAKGFGGRWSTVAARGAVTKEVVGGAGSLFRER